MDAQTQHFYWSLQALAQPARVQLTLFPNFVVVAEELALDLGNWLAVVIENELVVPKETISLAQEIDTLLQEASGPASTEWSESALATSMMWQRIRRLATEALSAAGLPAAPPPGNRSEYASIGG